MKAYSEKQRCLALRYPTMDDMMIFKQSVAATKNW